MNYIDIAILVVFSLFALRGFLRGFWVSILKISSLIISVIFSKLFYKELALLIFSKSQGTIDSIADGVRSFVIASLPSGGTGSMDFTQMLEGYSPELAKSLGTDLSALEGMNQLPSDLLGTQIEKAVDALTEQISSIVIYAGSFIAILLVSLLVMNILILIASGIRKLPIIGPLDGLFGLGLGIVESFVLLFVFLFIVETFQRADMFHDFVLAVDQSFIAKCFVGFSLKFFDMLLPMIRVASESLYIG